jgi:urease accessory protein
MNFSLLLLPHFHEIGQGGLYAGFVHPITGLDHFLAMVTVGLLSAQMGGRAIWMVPLTFVSVMAVGGGLGIAGISLPGVELGVSSSVVVLGVAVAAKRNIPVGVAMTFVGLFALFHGLAHGAELPVIADTSIEVLSYVFGFLVATASLHLVGALVGQIAVDSNKGSTVLRAGGVLISLLGIYLVVGLVAG